MSRTKHTFEVYETIPGHLRRFWFRGHSFINAMGRGVLALMLIISPALIR